MQVLQVILLAGGKTMAENAFVETTKITSKGQATIPKSVREVIGVEPGDKISFVVCDESVQVVSANKIAQKSKEHITEKVHD